MCDNRLTLVPSCYDSFTNTWEGTLYITSLLIAIRGAGIGHGIIFKISLNQTLPLSWPDMGPRRNTRNVNMGGFKGAGYERRLS